MKVRPPFPAICIVTAFLLLAIALPGSAYAQFSINSPKVEKGELEVETHGSVQNGFPKTEDEDDEDGGEKLIRQGHEVEVGYGFTDFWQAELGLNFQKPVGDGFEASSIEIENTFQLGKIDRWNATVGLLASLSLGIGGADEPDAVEIGPLIQFGHEDSGSLILNGIFEKTFGENREEGVGFEYAAQVRFPITEKIGLGAEAFGEIEDIGNTPDFEDTELRVGPMLYVSFGDKDEKKGKGDDDDDKGSKAGSKEPEIELGMGVLFGATDATPDVTVKWDLEVAF
jgi:hypothetical protein